MSTPIVSFQTVSGTFDGTRDENRDRILSPEVVEFLGEQPGASLVNFIFQVEGTLPDDGLEVLVNVDANFADYFSNLGRSPFGGGGKVMGAVYAEDGMTPTGIRVLLTSPNALFSLTAAQTETAETDGPETLNFSLASGAGYSVDAAAQSSVVTFYDTLADVPAPTSTPTVGLSIDNTALVESEGTELTLTFNVDGAIPEGGVLVYVDSGVRAAVGEFNVFGGEISGGLLPSPNFAISGFYFTILENGATITVPVNDESTNDQIPPEAALEGVEGFTFSLIEGPGYAIDSAAAAVSYTIADNADSVPLVSLRTSPAVLAESEGTVSVHEFAVSTVPPAEGITVSVSATNLGDFDLAQIAVTGGEIAGVNADGSGFDFKITAQNATIELPIANDGMAEGLETAVFTLEAGSGYLVSASNSGGTFTLSDGAVAAPPRDVESNDTIATAVATGLSAENQQVSVSGALAQQTNPAVDQSEDVDFYAVELAAGDVLRMDTDARSLLPSPASPDTVIQLFDAAGNLLAQSDDDFAPDEAFSTGRQDSYAEFTATAAGTYYVGISSFPNGNFSDFVQDDGTLRNAPYDPNQAGSGTGRSSGAYTLNLSLNQPFTASETIIPAGDGTGPQVSLTASAATYSREDNLIASSLVQFVENRAASILTLGLSTEGAIPAEGIEVFLKSNIDLSTVFSTSTPFSPGGGAEVLGAVYDATGAAIGLRVKLNSSDAVLNLNLANAAEAPSDGPETVTFTLEPSTGYRVGTREFSTTIYDTLEAVPPASNLPTVGVSISEAALVESVGNTTTLTFSLDGPPPAGGVLVNLDSGARGALGEFDVFNAQITGGDFPSPNFRASGFFFNMTEQTATITLAAFDETTNPQIPAANALEGIEEFTFTVQPGVGYAVAPGASAVTLTIADNPDSVVITPPDGDGGGGGGTAPAIPVETEFNDTIADATDTGLSVFNTSFTLQGAINSTRATRNLIDATEDVDMYAFQAQAGDTVRIDVDSISYTIEGIDREQRVDTELRIFNAAGEELVLNTEAPAPGELFTSGRDAYVEFTATEAGTYYAGVALLSNRAYDPNVAGSGSGRVFPNSGINVGEYTIQFDLAPINPVSVITGNGNVFGTNGSDNLVGGSGNDNLYGNEGQNVLMGLGGNDQLFGGNSSDVAFGGDGDDTLYANEGRDVLSGGAGNDVLFAGGGDDVLMGVTGDDILYGNHGSDLFVFGNGDGTDTIMDFQMGMDRIGLVEGELTYADLNITQDGLDTVLGVSSSGETLAILKYTHASMLGESSFAMVPDVSDPVQALALV
ncbi:MAG: hypothetical protein HC824_02315 [Synechococcales cyanobacterium RM1_1_8]|nr:hypothetical protein [Synechococcales cyanobacterium RM1_1_8]